MSSLRTTVDWWRSLIDFNRFQKQDMWGFIESTMEEVMCIFYTTAGTKWQISNVFQKQIYSIFINLLGN